MEFDEKQVTGGVVECISVHTEPLHHTIRTRYTSVGHCPHNHVRGYRLSMTKGAGFRYKRLTLGLQIEIVPEIIMLLTSEKIVVTSGATQLTAD